MFGYTEDEVVGQALSILMPERFRPMHDAGIKRVAEGGMAAARLIGQTVEVVGLRKDGREFPLELSLAMWETAGARFFSGIIRDISERKKAEEKLKAVLETAPDPIVEVDHDGTIALRQRAHRQALRLRPRADHRPPGRGALRRAHPHAGRRALRRRAAEQGERLAGRPRHGPRAVGPAQGRHRVPGRRHALGRCRPTTASSSPASSATSRSASASRTSCSTWPTTTR